jgi:hypothetical protein
MLGVIYAPRATFELLAAAPRWGDVLALTFLVTALSSAFLFKTETGRLALLDQWERTALAFGQTVGDPEYAALTRASDNGAVYAIASAFANGPVLTLTLTAILFALFRRFRGGGVRFRQVFAVVAHAGVILTLRHVIAAPVVYARETLASPATLNLFFATLDETSAPARFFGVIDLFVVWWIVVLAIGMSVLCRKPAHWLALSFMGAYAVLAAILTLAMMLTGGTA